MNTSAIIVDDMPRSLHSLERIVGSLGVKIFSTRSPSAAFRMIERNANLFTFVLIRYNMRGCLGTDLARRIQEELGEASPPCILVTSTRSIPNDDTPRGVCWLKTRNLGGGCSSPLDPEALTSCLWDVYGIPIGKKGEKRPNETLQKL